MNWRYKSIAVLAVFSLMVYRGYRQIIPSGASVIPWLYASSKGPVISSPDNEDYSVYFNDAGGMHSGNYWTWIVSSSFLWGRSVVAQGYVSDPVRFGDVDFPVVGWKENAPIVDFEEGQR
jgi:hypothetical protein